MGSCFAVQAGLGVLICQPQLPGAGNWASTSTPLSTWIFLWSKQARSSRQSSRDTNPSGKYTFSGVDGDFPVSSSSLGSQIFEISLEAEFPALGWRLTLNRCFPTCISPKLSVWCHWLLLAAIHPRLCSSSLNSASIIREACPSKLRRHVLTKREERSLGNRWFLQLQEYLVPHCSACWWRDSSLFLHLLFPCYRTELSLDKKAEKGTVH